MKESARYVKIVEWSDEHPGALLPPPPWTPAPVFTGGTFLRGSDTAFYPPFSHLHHPSLEGLIYQSAEALTGHKGVRKSLVWGYFSAGAFQHFISKHNTDNL